MTELEREELETYRMKSENGQIAAYYLLAEELGVKAYGSVVDTVANIVKERDRYKRALERIEEHWDGDDGEIDPVFMAHAAKDALLGLG